MNVYPDRDAFLAMRAEGNVIPVFTEELTDMLTAVSAYMRVSEGAKQSFLLESVAGGEKLGRYSFIGANPHKTLTTSPTDAVGDSDPLRPIEDAYRNLKVVKHHALPDFTGGVVGYVAYDAVRHFEPRVARDMKDALDMPESHLMFFNDLVIFDHLKHTVKIVANVFVDTNQDDASSVALYDAALARISKMHTLLHTGPNVTPRLGTGTKGPMVSNFTQEGFETVVRNLKQDIVNGEIIQAVPSQRMSRPTSASPFNIYRQLRSINPSPYLFYLDLDDYQVYGASPEALCKVCDGTVEMHPIAGTRKRGKTPEEDVANEKELLADPKEVAEHAMLVDLGRNDVNRVCIPETVRVTSLMHIERYSHVMHIVSNVQGKLKPELTSFDAFRSILPAGTLSGAPKIRAVELVSEYEGELRGIYGGAVGYFGYNGDMDTAIAIRCMVYKDGVCYLQAGAGIVYDSDPTSEYNETINKLMGNIKAIAAAEEFEERVRARTSASNGESNDNKKRKLETDQ